MERAEHAFDACPEDATSFAAWRAAHTSPGSPPGHSAPASPARSRFTPLPRIMTAPASRTSSLWSAAADTSPPGLVHRSLSHSPIRRTRAGSRHDRDMRQDPVVADMYASPVSPLSLAPDYEHAAGQNRPGDGPRRATRQEAAVLKVCALVSFIVACALGAAAAALYIARHPEAFTLIYFTTLTLGLLLSLAILVVGASREGQASARAPLAALLACVVLAAFLLVLHRAHVGGVAVIGGRAWDEWDERRGARGGWGDRGDRDDRRQMQPAEPSLAELCGAIIVRLAEDAAIATRRVVHGARVVYARLSAGR